jgi:hypothetical protein
MKKTALLFSLMLCVHQLFAQTLSVQQTHHDFILLRKILQEAHPSLYWYTPKDSLDRDFDDTFSQLNHPMNEDEFYLLLSPLISKIRCGHTLLFHSLSYESQQQITWLPMRLQYLDNKMYIVEVSKRCSDSTLTRGTEILAIDDIPVAEIVTKTLLMISSDGYNQTLKEYFLSLYRFEDALMTIYHKKEPFHFVVKDTVGNIHKSTVFTKKRTMPIKPEPPRSAAETKQAKAKELANMRQYKTIGQNNEAMLLTSNGFGYEDYKAFHKKVFEEINAKKINHLIIDLRNNSGGDTDMSDDILKYVLTKPTYNFLSCDAPVNKLSFNQYVKPAPKDHLFNPNELRKIANGKYRRVVSGASLLVPYQRLHFSGKIYVLTSGLTFSAGAILASLLKAHCHAVFIGQETGGGEVGCSGGLISKIILPESKMILNLPHFQIHVNTQSVNVGRGIMPDYPIFPTYQAITQGKDLALEMASALIIGNK